MSRGEEANDVFYSGILLYKSRALKSCQKCRAELKFESRHGFKRLELYPTNGNRKMSGSPSTTIYLTNALGVVNAKQHTITRAKHIFQIITPRERYQLSALTEEEKKAWLFYLDRILNHMPVDNRTCEFHVSVSPTTHSDSLKLTGQYMLKISETELHLYSASGTIQSKFWSPLSCIKDAQNYLVPSSTSSPLSGWINRLGGATRNSGTQYLLVITTEGSSPHGKGMFAFFTDSAKDIATTIIQRKETRILTRAKETQALSSSSSEPTRSEEDTVKSTFHPKPQSMKSASNKITIDDNPRTLSEGEGRRRERELEKQREESDQVRRLSREQEDGSPVRNCKRRSRMIPMSHQLEKAKSKLKLPLEEKTVDHHQMFSPDEPTHVAIEELTKQQEIFREWKRKREEVEWKTRTSPGDLFSPSSSSSHRQLSRRSTISTPTPELEQSQISDISSLEGTYVTIFRNSIGWELQASQERDEERNENEEEEVEKKQQERGEEVEGEKREDGREKMEKEMSLGKMRGLARQKPIDILSPDEESDYVMMRPRTNAMFFSDNSPPRTSPPRTALSYDDKYTPSDNREEEKLWQCDEESCWLRPKPSSNGAATKQRKSDSEPQLRINSCCSEVEYLKILPFIKKSPKKPKPTPRTRIPPLDLSCRNSLCAIMTPPTPTTQGHAHPPLPSPHRTLPRGLDVCKLLSSQRSLSESNIFQKSAEGGEGEDPDDVDDEYVDMSKYNPLWDHQKHYISYDQLLDLPDSGNSRRGGGAGGDCEGRSRGMRRQFSNSCGDIPAMMMDGPQPRYENAQTCITTTTAALFLETEDIYENGREAMEHYLYGEYAGVYSDDEEYKGHREVATAACCHGDSGLGSTPSCSPLFSCQKQRSFSLDDIRHIDSNRNLAEGQ